MNLESKQPPRPPNCFMIWSTEKRKEIAKNTNHKNNIDTSIFLGKIWNSMTEQHKLQYKIMANNLKKKHEIKYPNYKYQPKQRIDKTKVKRTVKRTVNIIQKKQKIVKPKLQITKEIFVNNNDDEPDYFNQVQLFYESLININESEFL